MTKYYCTVVFDASSNVTVEANSPEEAAEMAVEKTDGSQRLCHHCADSLDTGDAIGAIVHNEEATKELYDSRWYPPKQRPERVVFPTMLRKMWSGSEVQAWLDANVNKESA